MNKISAIEPIRAVFGRLRGWIDGQLGPGNFPIVAKAACVTTAALLGMVWHILVSVQ